MEQIRTVQSESQAIPDVVEEELTHYEEQIKRYRAGELDETKMQKLRLHFGTYAQRQEGVQMQRIKIPGGVLTADQLVTLADAADRFGSGFIHFTTREDAQIYYVKLEEAPDTPALFGGCRYHFARGLREHGAQYHRLLSSRHFGNRGFQCIALRRRSVSLSGA